MSRNPTLRFSPFDPRRQGCDDFRRDNEDDFEARIRRVEQEHARSSRWFWAGCTNAVVITFIISILIGLALTIGGIMAPTMSVSLLPAYSEEIVLQVPQRIVTTNTFEGRTPFAPGEASTQPRRPTVFPKSQNDEEVKCGKLVPNACANKWAIIGNAPLPAGFRVSDRFLGLTCRAECTNMVGLSSFQGVCVCTQTPELVYDEIHRMR